MADTDITAQETDGAQRWYDAVTALALLAELTRRVETLEAWQAQHDGAQAHRGETMEA